MLFIKVKLISGMLGSQWKTLAGDRRGGVGGGGRGVGGDGGMFVASMCCYLKNYFS